mgnify:CR=1 FL=1
MTWNFQIVRKKKNIDKNYYDLIAPKEETIIKCPICFDDLCGAAEVD